MSVEQADVELTNRNGRLHPSQRGKVLNFNFWVAAVLVVAGVVGLVLVPVTTIDTRFGSGLAGASVVSALATMVPILALAGFFAVVCWRRVADVREGRLVTVTGWTHDFDQKRATDAYPIGLHHSPAGFKSAESFVLRTGGRTYALDRKLRQRIQAERTNTVLLTPRSKLLINVIPT